MAVSVSISTTRAASRPLLRPALQPKKRLSTALLLRGSIQMEMSGISAYETDYLIGTPLLADYLEEGLSPLGYSIEDFEIGRM